MNKTFQVGDIITLNSNTLVAMTVETILPSGDVTAVWFDADKELARETFSVAMVELK